jgi:hypothetical protein
VYALAALYANAVATDESGENLVARLLGEAGLTIAELRNLVHQYLTLSEAIKLAAIAFGKDVAKLRDLKARRDAWGSPGGVGVQATHR